MPSQVSAGGTHAPQEQLAPQNRRPVEPHVVAHASLLPDTHSPAGQPP
jgi:hypothetical protein